MVCGEGAGFAPAADSCAVAMPQIARASTRSAAKICLAYRVILVSLIVGSVVEALCPIMIRTQYSRLVSGCQVLRISEAMAVSQCDWAGQLFCFKRCASAQAIISSGDFCMFLLTEPNEKQLRAFHASQIDRPFSYAEVGASRQGAPQGFNLDHHRIKLG